MKNPITAFIDKKLQKFDPLWQGRERQGRPAQPLP